MKKAINSSPDAVSDIFLANIKLFKQYQIEATLCTKTHLPIWLLKSVFREYIHRHGILPGSDSTALDQSGSAAYALNQQNIIFIFRWGNCYKPSSHKKLRKLSGTFLMKLSISWGSVRRERHLHHHARFWLHPERPDRQRGSR